MNGKKVIAMKTSKLVLGIAAFLALALFGLNACKSDTVSEPAPLGPSSIGVVLDLTANPSVIIADELHRQTASVTAILSKFDGIPIADRTIVFEVVNSSGRRVGIGFLDDELAMQTVKTDSNGTAKVKYSGPLRSEIKSNTDVFIRATVVWDGVQHIQDSIQLYVIRADN
jgi:hypothetical protein